MKLDRKEINGSVYYELYIPCPVCREREIHAEPKFCIHEHCGGRMYIGDDARLFCDRCNGNSPLWYWHPKCSQHSMLENSETIVLSETPAGYFMGNWISGYIVSIAGKEWLQRFLNNMGEF